MNKTITTLLAAAGIAAAAPASAVVIGGVDFGTLGGAPSRTHLETATLAQTFVNGNGQNATAYGFITTVNGDNTLLRRRKRQLRTVLRSTIQQLAKFLLELRRVHQLHRIRIL